MPLTTSPMDGFINPIRASIRPRAYGLKNRERTNRMLMLMQLHANRQDDAARLRPAHPRVPRGQPRAVPASPAARSSMSAGACVAALTALQPAQRIPVRILNQIAHGDAWGGPSSGAAAKAWR